jgi:hypothetical protein
MSTVTGYDNMTHGQTKAVISKMGGVEVALAFLRGEYVLTKIATGVTSALLATIGTVSLPATTKPFVARDKFVVNTKANAEVKISFIYDDFTNWFLANGGKVEEPQVGACELRYAKLKKSTSDELVIAELGGVDKSETTLSEMFCLMEKQKGGEDGVLLNNGWTNIFYIRDNKGVLRAVCMNWHDGGWGVSVFSVENVVNVEYGDRLVFSRN